jgi:hypothetical protein
MDPLASCLGVVSILERACELLVCQATKQSLMKPRLLVICLSYDLQQPPGYWCVYVMSQVPQWDTTGETNWRPRTESQYVYELEEHFLHTRSTRQNPPLGSTRGMAFASSPASAHASSAAGRKRLLVQLQASQEVEKLRADIELMRIEELHEEEEKVERADRQIQGQQDRETWRKFLRPSAEQQIFTHRDALQGTVLEPAIVRISKVLKELFKDLASFNLRFTA